MSSKSTIGVGGGHPLWKQIMTFGLVGGAQILFDSLMFVLLTFMGVSVPVGNLIGRISGACLGYWLNGRYTFAQADGDSALSRKALFRFIVSWIATSLISTGLVTALASAKTLEFAWIAKPVMDGLLAVAGFVILKKWVYR
ncbi:GtrA family protein [Pseudomonas sp. CGJS7]|uniref:GtrA family protein n=1 Tax=Pseudomonas sp. CGJS7 TaxID=3109348 RepID=UPI00300B3133